MQAGPGLVLLVGKANCNHKWLAAAGYAGEVTAL